MRKSGLEEAQPGIKIARRNINNLRYTGLPLWLSWWRICLQCRRPQFDSWTKTICWRRDRLSTPVFLSFPGGSVGEESAYQAGDLDLIPGLGRSPGEGKGYLLQYSGLENSMDSIFHGVTKNQTWLRDFHLSFQICRWHHPMAKVKRN